MEMKEKFNELPPKEYSPQCSSDIDNFMFSHRANRWEEIYKKGRIQKKMKKSRKMKRKSRNKKKSWKNK